MKPSTVKVMALCGSLLLACAALAAPANLGGLDIHVVDSEGAPVQDALVVVRTSSGEELYLVTDEEGRAWSELKVRGQQSLLLTVAVAGGDSVDLSLDRGEVLSPELVVPASRGYEWVWVD